MYNIIRRVYKKKNRKNQIAYTTSMGSSVLSFLTIIILRLLYMLCRNVELRNLESHDNPYIICIYITLYDYADILYDCVFFDDGFRTTVKLNVSLKYSLK